MVEQTLDTHHLPNANMTGWLRGIIHWHPRALRAFGEQKMILQRCRVVSTLRA
jgi:hypothetical protein